MNGKIKKIDSIKNMAVFQDFSWASSVRDGGNNVAEFKKINILYGRNYSGKTTLSRIFRALEIGSISDKYSSLEFQLCFEEGFKVTQDSLDGHGQVVRVFNEDFVKDNLRFIVDDEQAINSFAILGEDNKKLEAEIKNHEADFGNKVDRTGLIGNFLNADKEFKDARKAFEDKSSELESKLRNKANKADTGIKHNKEFGDANYNVTKIKEDINVVTKDSYTRPTDVQVGKYRSLLREAPKKEIAESAAFDLKYSTVAANAKKLTEKKIKTTDPIQEWLDDTDLAKWINEGRKFHEEKREECAFCGSAHPVEHWQELWEKLDKHFDHKLKDLGYEIDKAIESIEAEIKRVPNLFKIKETDFYSEFAQDLNDLSDRFDTLSKTYCGALESIKQQLKKRKDDIVTPLSFDKPASVEQDLNAIRDGYEELRKKSDLRNSELETKQSEAREVLRLHEVFKFTTDIKYADECKTIEGLEKAMKKAEKKKDGAQADVKAKQTEINNLKTQLKDESKGADRVNDYLNNFFGHQSLSLKATKETNGDVSSGYRFEVLRNDEKAFHLSEGECSLIAFCYFMAKLEDIETKGNQPIIWIDDPISSLDANHIFFVYSLINSAIVKPKNFVQLFISTHNLNFLKYLKRISKDYKGEGKNRVKIREFFIVERSGDSSLIGLMPKYLKNYVTEFNYLFQQVYKCATAESIDDKNHHEFYNFGNNARKFLEIYLYYKYPNGIESDDRLEKFFGKDSIPALFTDRVSNEYSHLPGGFERGAMPIEVPEMKTVAQQIISKVREDSEQYSALLQSIGVKNDLMDKAFSTTQKDK